MTKANITRRLGVATYEARWVARTNMVQLVARGILPCSNYRAQLEERPERVLPVMWNLVFFTQDICQKGLRSFTSKVYLVNSVGAQELMVHDALGEHRIPIQPAFDLQPEASETEGVQAQNHVVYARIPPPKKGHHGCVIVPEGTIMPAIYGLVFGPATHSQCKSYTADLCAPHPGDTEFQADEMPWPELLEE